MEYILRAPIDGHISKVDYLFLERKAISGISPAQYLYHKLYKSYGKEYWKSPSINKLLAGESREVDDKDLQKWGLIESGVDEPIIIITPENLEMAIALEESKIAAARILKDSLSQRYNYETKKVNDEEKLLNERVRENSFSKAESGARALKEAGSRKFYKKYRADGKNEATSISKVSASRRDFAVNTTLHLELEASKTSLLAAEMSLKLLLANNALGQICVPQGLKVVEILVYPGQYVNKRDPIIRLDKQHA